MTKGKTLRNGRSGAEPRHLRLYHWLLECPAWKSLDVYERALYVEFKARYNGTNNGDIGFSHDEMERALNCSNRPVDRARDTLIARGFIKVQQAGHFDWKGRGEGRSRSTTYTLTEHSIDMPVRLADPATKEFMKWRGPADDLPVKKKARGDKSTPMVGRNHTMKSGMVRPKHTNGVTTAYEQGQNENFNGVRKAPSYNIPLPSAEIGPIGHAGDLSEEAA